MYRQQGKEVRQAQKYTAEQKSPENFLVRSFNLFNLLFRGFSLLFDLTNKNI